MTSWSLSFEIIMNTLYVFGMSYAIKMICNLFFFLSIKKNNLSSERIQNALGASHKLKVVLNGIECYNSLIIWFVYLNLNLKKNVYSVKTWVKSLSWQRPLGGDSSFFSL